ncbi:dihydroxyacetone kinase-like protein [Arthrobacter pigmenti]|uniref:Dihydroxyacetone kinase-like protein n=1 Tax=Arthrobacter pigmenti TaxID=271432 RepID=A0A846REE6_9MICC|nr:dihydroxyacetone kinase subunit DhaL [Arthrobacter pigmenti]NJC21508.1 dihydroxyacetone kinase-like protein [Arthrobacter pigmenti]
MTVEYGEITRADLDRWIREFARRIISEHESLSDLDAASGDADHGSNMERGMTSLLEALGNWDPGQLPGTFLKEVGLHVVESVGGSSGALYGTIFLRLARVVGDAPAVNQRLMVEAFEAAAQGIVDRGKVKRGDKTMFDALSPAVEALRSELTGDRQSWNAAFRAAATAAEGGRDATADMVARRGKSSYARLKSRGVIDPGAASAAMLVCAAAATLGADRDRSSRSEQVLRMS